MKSILVVTLLSFAVLLSSQVTYQDEDQTHLWGEISTYDLQKQPYLDWYSSSQKDYSPVVEKKQYSNLKDTKVKIFLGTWCGDTKNYLPKFIKLWEQAGLPKINLELIAVHNDDEHYKQGPNREEAEYGLHRVPTFIFQRDGKEIARIVEHPVTSLEIDLAQIAAGIPTDHSYAGVTHLQEYFATQDADSLNNYPKGFLNKLFEQVSYVGELTTFAKKLDTDGFDQQAEFVYRVNTRLFRYHPYSHYRLGKYLLDQSQYEEAREHFYKTLEMEPGYMNTCKYIVELKEAEKEQ